MGTKTGDEKFGHALHDDLTLSAICKVTAAEIISFLISLTEFSYIIVTII